MHQCYLNIHFSKNDTTFKETDAYIDSVYKNCIQDIIAGHRSFVLIPLSSKEELKNDRYIGVKRCLKLIAHFHAKYGIHETAFYISHVTEIGASVDKTLENGGRVACQTK